MFCYQKHFGAFLKNSPQFPVSNSLQICIQFGFGQVKDVSTHELARTENFASEQKILEVPLRIPLTCFLKNPPFPANFSPPFVAFSEMFMVTLLHTSVHSAVIEEELSSKDVPFASYLSKLILFGTRAYLAPNPLSRHRAIGTDGDERRHPGDHV